MVYYGYFYGLYLIFIYGGVIYVNFVVGVNKKWMNEW